MLRVSNYVVFGETEYRATDGRSIRLVYGTRQSKVVPLQSAVAEQLRTGRLDELADSTRALLRRVEILIDASEGDELDVVTARNAARARDTGLLHIALLPTSYCNMGCSYCGQQHQRGRLDETHRDRVRARVTGLIARPDVHAVRIDWFGAEPLIGLPAIVDLSKDFRAAAAKHDVRYTAVVVTNGSLLSVTSAHRLQGAGVSHLEVTLDGPPAVHDAHRPLKNGGGSFWKIVRAIQDCLAEPELRGLNFRIRSNVDSRNISRMTQFYRLMAVEGFAHPRVEFSIHPVHAWGNDVSDAAIPAEDYAAAEAEWLSLMSTVGLRVALLPNRPASIVCPAVTRMGEVVSSTGKVFCCSEQPLVPSAEANDAVGTLAELSTAAPGQLIPLRPLGAFDNWNADVAQSKVPCARCVFFPTCGGSCPKAWAEGNPPCPSYKHNVHDRLNLVATRSGLVPVS